MTEPQPTPSATGFVAEFRQLIDGVRQPAAKAVNTGLSLRHWQVGGRLHREVLGSEPTGYGEQIVAIRGPQLTVEYGRARLARHLRLCILPARAYPGPEVVHAMRAKLSCSHIVEPLRSSDIRARDFFENQSLQGRGSLREFIGQKKTLQNSCLAFSKSKTGILQLTAQGQIVEQPVDLSDADVSLKDPREQACALGHWVVYELLTGRPRLA